MKIRKMEFIWLKLLLVFTLLSNFAKVTEGGENGSPNNQNSDVCKNTECKICNPESRDLKIHWDFKYNMKCKQSRCCKNLLSSLENCNETICTETIENGIVSMISKCPINTSTDEAVKTYCEYQKGDLRHDLWLTTPVTHSQSNRTYKNVFCAHCHDMHWKNVTFWELRPYCVDAEKGEPIHPKDQNIDIANLLPTNKGFWKKWHHDKHLCFLHPSTNASLNLDLCWQNSQSSGPVASANCSNTSLPSEPNSNLSMIQLVYGQNPSPKFSRCEEHLPPDLMELLCPLPDDRMKKCKLDLITCDHDKYYFVNEWSNLEDYEKYKINETTIYACKSGETLSEESRHLIMQFVTFLVRALLVALAICLLIYVWLPKKSTFDMCIAVLSVIMLLQGVCVANSYNGHKLYFTSCRVSAAVWHYTILCTSSWMMILSYDYWLNLYQVFSIYQLVDEYSRLQFLIYFVLCQVLPAAVTGAALFFGSGVGEVYCHQPHGLKKYECLLAEVPNVDVYFIVSTAILFVANTYYLLRVAWIACHEKLSSRDRQRLHNRSTLAKGSPLWMLASLLLLGHYELPLSDCFICGVFFLQGLFFVYVAFAQMMTRLLKMVDEIQHFARKETPNRITSGQEDEMPEPTAAPGQYRSIECAYGDVYL